MDKFNNYKEKNVLDLSSYKERLENIIKTFQFVVDNYNNSQIKYLTKLNDQTNKNILNIVDEKLKNLRMENSHFSLDLLKKSNDLNSIYDKIKLIKDKLIQEIDLIIKENDNKINNEDKPGIESGNKLAILYNAIFYSTTAKDNKEIKDIIGLAIENYINLP